MPKVGDIFGRLKIVICKRANTIKSDATPQELILIARNLRRILVKRKA